MPWSYMMTRNPKAHPLYLHDLEVLGLDAPRQAHHVAVPGACVLGILRWYSDIRVCQVSRMARKMVKKEEEEEEE